jgi:hypothetical protein
VELLRQRVMPKRQAKVDAADAATSGKDKGKDKDITVSAPDDVAASDPDVAAAALVSDVFGALVKVRPLRANACLASIQ